MRTPYEIREAVFYNRLRNHSTLVTYEELLEVSSFREVRPDSVDEGWHHVYIDPRIIWIPHWSTSTKDVEVSYKCIVRDIQSFKSAGHWLFPESGLVSSDWYYADPSEKRSINLDEL